MPRPVEGNRSYNPGLDGLRAIAVLGVIAYHLNFAWATGGLLGVGVFFVLSGYLITDLLLAEYRRHQRIALGQFWLRRARRLLPALFVMLFVVVVWSTLFARGQLSDLKNDLLPAIFYVSNWWFIFHHVSYFSRFGPPAVLGHLWSLAVEEQFYLFWPLILFAALRWVKDRRIIVAGVVTLAVGVGPRDGPPLLAGDRPHPGLRRDRHPGIRPPDRCRAGLRLAPGAVVRPDHPRRPSHPRTDRRCRRWQASSPCTGAPASTTRSSIEAAWSCCRCSPPLVIAVCCHPGARFGDVARDRRPFAGWANAPMPCTSGSSR